MAVERFFVHTLRLLIAFKIRIDAFVQFLGLSICALESYYDQSISGP
jgi:hypothetical protein